MPSKKQLALLKLLEATRRTYKQRSLTRITRVCERKLEKAFKAQGRMFLRGLATMKQQWPQPATEALREAEAADFLTGTDPIFTSAELNSLSLFLEPLTDTVNSSLTAGAGSLLAQIKYDLSFSLANPRAVSYIASHGADLVTRINATTRADIQRILKYGIENGWSYNRVAAAIQAQYRHYYDTDSYWNMDAQRPQGHIDSRAHLISVTEAGNAYEAGNAIVAQDLADGGLVMEKHWSTMRDGRVSDGCRDNEAEGWIPAARPHGSGHMHPLRFPGCRCDELYRQKQ